MKNNHTSFKSIEMFVKLKSDNSTNNETYFCWFELGGDVLCTVFQPLGL